MKAYNYQVIGRLGLIPGAARTVGNVWIVRDLTSKSEIATFGSRAEAFARAAELNGRGAA